MAGGISPLQRPHRVTLLWQVLRDASLKDIHRPVVLHVNYHQPKPPKMLAAARLYHEGDDLAARAELRREPHELLNTTVLEAEAWLQLNGGYIGGRDFSQSAASAATCAPAEPQLGFTYELHSIHPAGTQLPAPPQCGERSGGGDGGDGGGGARYE